MKQYKILLSAYACEPGRGSEPGVGWNWALQIAKFHKIWVITRTNNKPLIENFLKQNPNQNLNFIFIDLPTYLTFWKKGQRGIRLYYYLWQLRAYLFVKSQNMYLKFDIVHHITLGTYWLPSMLYKLPLPFIFGPVGGGDSMPSGFISNMDIKGKLFEIFRNIRLYLSNYDPFVYQAINQAQIVLVNTNETGKRVKKFGSSSVRIISHMGINLEEFKERSHLEIENRTKVRFVSIGRQIPWKGYRLSIEAFNLLIQMMPDCEYILIGDGSENDSLQSRTHELGLNDKVSFIKNISRSQVIEYLYECDVMVHPALHDSAPSAVLEAMAAGMPVICLDLGGPSVQVTSETGIKISARSTEQVINDMANAMFKLVKEPNLRCEMGDNGRKRIKEHFTWEKKGEFIDHLYSEVLSGHENTLNS